MIAFAPTAPPLRYRVFHRHFDRLRTYALVAISDYADTAPARLWFHTDSGWLWAVDQRRCLAVGGPESVPLTPDEEQRYVLPRRRPRSDFE